MRPLDPFVSAFVPLKLMADHIPVMVWMSDTEGRGTFFNRRWLQFTGRSMEQELGEGWLNGVHPEDRQRAIDCWQRACGSRDVVTIEYRLRRADGAYRWMLDQGAPLYDELRRFAGYVGAAADVTEQKLAAGRILDTQEALAASESRFRLLAEHARDVVYRYRVHPTMGCEYASPAANEILGVAPEEFYADPELLFTLILEEDRPTAFRMRASPQDFVDPVRLRWRRRDGCVVWIEHRQVPIYEDGRLVAIEGIGRDITQMVMVKNRLKASESQLRKLAGRIQALREEERTHLARELHDELGQRLTSIKLDLGRLGQFMAGDADHTLRQALLRTVIDSVDQCTVTIQRLSRELRPAALDHFGLSAAIELETAAVQTRTGIRCRVFATGGDVRLDREQATAIFRIVQEALTNVQRHANASAVSIRIRQSVRLFRVQIHDNGRGISEEQLNDPHSLGLLGMRERAMAIGGFVQVSGVRGHGTRVVVSVPLSLAASRQTA